MRSLVAAPLMAAVLLCAMPGAVSAQERTYQTVFYPKGMPSRQGWDGKERPALYHFLADVELTGKAASVVLYSEETVTGASDNVFAVFLGLVRTRNGISQSQATIDLTKYLPVYVESPGNVHHVTGALNRFMATPSLTAVHVNLWAVLSGSGSTGAGSDLIFAVNDAPGVFTPLLLLTDTSRFSREGPGRYVMKDVDLYLAKVDRDPAMEVIVNRLAMPGSGAGDRVGLRGDVAEVYKLSGGQYRLENRLRMTDLPKTAARVKRSPEIAEVLGR